MKDEGGAFHPDNRFHLARMIYEDPLDILFPRASYLVDVAFGLVFKADLLLFFSLSVHLYLLYVSFVRRPAIKLAKINLLS